MSSFIEKNPVATGLIFIGILMLLGFWFGSKLAGYRVKSYYGGGMASGTVKQPIYANRNEINRIRKVSAQGVFNANGTPLNVNGNLKQKTCGDICSDLGATGDPSWSVSQYPKGSQYYPHYMCWCHMGPA